MDPKQFKQILARLKQHLIASRKENARLTGMDAIAFIDQRVREKGRNAQKQAFGIYADSTKKSKERKGKTQAPYPNINFTDTTHMWSHILPVVESETKKGIRVTIKPTTKDSTDRLRWNTEKFGPILQLSEEEKDHLREFTRIRYRKEFAKFGL